MKHVLLSNLIRSHDIIERLRACQTYYGYIDYPCDRWILDISHVHLGYFVLWKFNHDTCQLVDPVHLPYGYQDTAKNLIDRYEDYKKPVS